MTQLKQGLVQIYTGSGKGKTTAALGLVVRAAGHGFRSKIIQFLKGSGYAGELFSLQKLYPLVVIEQYGLGCRYSALIRLGKESCRGCGQCFISRRGVQEEDKHFANLALEASSASINSGDFDIIVLDEIGNALRFKLITAEQVIELIKNKPDHVELVLTGRGIPDSLFAYADLVTEFNVVKHPYQAGISSRRGVEY